MAAARARRQQGRHSVVGLQLQAGAADYPAATSAGGLLASLGPRPSPRVRRHLHQCVLLYLPSGAAHYPRGVLSGGVDRPPAYPQQWRFQRARKHRCRRGRLQRHDPVHVHRHAVLLRGQGGPVRRHARERLLDASAGVRSHVILPAEAQQAQLWVHVCRAGNARCVGARPESRVPCVEDLPPRD